MKDMQYKRFGADPCIYYKWTTANLIIWLPWIDDYMVWGHKSKVATEAKAFTDRFECDDVGKVKEYVGCKIERNEEERSFKFTQP
eukprot:5107865-Ditylum_brightwellii.AAC.1